MTYEEILQTAISALENDCNWSIRSSAAELLRTLMERQQPDICFSDPLDMPLPCDITIGAGTNRKGTSLRALVCRMQTLHEIAMTNNAAIRARGEVK